jgi:hypothetical protein
MKMFIRSLTAVVGLALSTATSHATLSLDFSSTLGSSIQFNGSGSSFQFNTSTTGIYSGSQFYIGNESGNAATGSALGLFGVFNNGPFTYGNITSSGGQESATVTGPLASLVIADGLGNNLTGTINWVEITTLDSAGGINADLTINLTGLAYAGLNTDLKTLVAGSDGALDLTFQFSPGLTLSQLSSGPGGNTTSFSGSMSVQTAVPEVSQVYAILFLMGLLGVASALRRLAV